MASAFVAHFPLFLLFPLIALLQIWGPSIIFCEAELQENNFGGIFEDKERIEVLRKILRQSGFTTDEEIEEAIIALGPPPKKRKFGGGGSEELMGEKQENMAEEEHKAQLHRRTKRMEIWSRRNESSANESSPISAFNSSIQIRMTRNEEEEWKRVNFTLPKEIEEDDGEGKIFGAFIAKLTRFFHISL